jgi:putative membrane protein
MKRQFAIFLMRWALNALGIWIATRLLRDFGVEYTGDGIDIALTGLILALINALLKPIIVVLSLPAIILTLGLFTLVVNGLMVYLAARFVPGISMTFSAAIVTGLIISIINYAITSVVDLKKEER